jgi:hypothetical protein
VAKARNLFICHIRPAGIQRYENPHRSSAPWH